MQAGLDRTDRIARNLMNFLEFIAFDVVQDDDQAVFVTEGGKRPIELHYVIQAFRVTHWIEVSGQRFDALPGELTLLDADQAGPREAPPIIDEVVVHDPAQPGARFSDLEQVIEPRECLEQYILEEILRFRFPAGEAKCETVQPLEMWPQQSVKARTLVLFKGTHAGRV